MRALNFSPALCAAVFLLPAASLRAQDGGSSGGEAAFDASRYTTRSSVFGAGWVNRLETYLSPLEYTGPEVRFLRESERMTRMCRGRVSVQQLFEGNLSYTKNPTKDSEYLAGDFAWRIGWHWNWKPRPRLRLMAGAQTGAGCGFVYNTSNGNNPAQAKLAADIAFSGQAAYESGGPRRGCVLRYQIDIPVAGLMFSPNYGQSYYEIFSLGHYDHNVCFTWPGNAPTFSQLLSADIPLGSGTLRLACRCDIRQSHVNNLKSHTWSCILMAGFVKRFRLVKKGDRDYSKTVF